MGVASGCGEQEVGVASGSGWNLWVWLLGVFLRRYIDFLILLIPTPLVSVLFCSSIPTSFFILLKLFCVLVYIILYIFTFYTIINDYEWRNEINHLKSDLQYLQYITLSLIKHYTE